MVDSMANELPREPRYRAVRIGKRQGFGLPAGIEDLANNDLIRVADASMAVRLSRLLNDEAEGKPLPERGPQHVPVRFQLAHPTYAGLSGGGAGVTYVHKSNVLGVAYSPREETAQQIARLLAHVDYPIDEKRGVFGRPRARDLGYRLKRLPDQSIGGPHKSSAPYRKRLWGWLRVQRGGRG